MLELFASNVFTARYDSPEATALINKHIQRRNTDHGYIWYAELGKDLVNYLDRPEFIASVLSQVTATLGVQMMYGTAAAFADALNSAQIQALLENKTSRLLLDNVQLVLRPDNISQFISTTANDFSRLYMKIESVRIPIIKADKRPYVGERVSPNEDMGIEPSPAFSQGLARTPYSYRFGPGHDGEHWLTNSIRTEVKATEGIRGTVLTYYILEGGLYAVMIRLINTNTVMLIKDLTSIGSVIKGAKQSYPDRGETKKVDESRFIDKSGNPIKPVELKANDLIGTTKIWEKVNARYYYPGYDRTFGTFHFAFLDYNIVQTYRTKLGEISKKKGGGGVASDEDFAMYSIEQKSTAIPESWFIPALSPKSPVRCFK